MQLLHRFFRGSKPPPVLLPGRTAEVCVVDLPADMHTMLQCFNVESDLCGMDCHLWSFPLIPPYNQFSLLFPLPSSSSPPPCADWERPLQCNSWPQPAQPPLPGSATRGNCWGEGVDESALPDCRQRQCQHLRPAQLPDFAREVEEVDGQQETKVGRRGRDGGISCVQMCQWRVDLSALLCLLQLERNAGGGDQRVHHSPHPGGGGIQLAVHSNGNTPSVCTHLSDGD